MAINWKEHLPFIMERDKAGLTYTEIANELCVKLQCLVTRSMVGGALHRATDRGERVKRDGDSRKVTNARMAVKKKLAPKPPKPIKTLPSLPKTPWAPEPYKSREKIPRYQPNWTCQWIDDAGKFCGVKCNGPYCFTHANRVYKRD